MKKEEIIRILKDIEKQENIEILYACEAGSRVWGFENKDSDYDIRFIYKKGDVKDYLSLKCMKDVIEYVGDEFDIVGWDIKKALNLHMNGNPNLREWLISNQVYIDNGIEHIFEDLGDFNIDVLKNHYFAIIRNHWKRYSSLEFSKTKTKKYLYVIRSILCWNILDNDCYPPINIHELLNHEHNGISDELTGDIVELINFHQGSGKISEEAIFRLNNFILNSLNQMQKVKTKSDKNLDAYDERFRELLLVC